MPTQCFKLMRFQSVHLNLLCRISLGRWVAPEIYNFSVKWRHDKKSLSHTLLAATFYFLKNFKFACLVARCFFPLSLWIGGKTRHGWKMVHPPFFLTWFFNIFSLSIFRVFFWSKGCKSVEEPFHFITFWLFNIWLVFPVVTPLKKVVSHANFLFNILSPTKSAEPPLDENKTSLSKIWRREIVPEINSCNWSSLLTSHKATFLKDNHLKSPQFSVESQRGINYRDCFQIMAGFYFIIFVCLIQTMLKKYLPREKKMTILQVFVNS